MTKTQRIAIVTDSSCDLDPELIKAYGIQVLPLHIVYHDREYRDRVDITPEEVYGQLDVEVPKTSLPSPAEISSLFSRLRDENFTHILAIHISSGLSGTFNAVSQVAEEFKDIVIEVLDSKNLSLGLGLPVLETAREIQRTSSFQNAISVAKAACHRTKAFYVLSTLEYLKRGGRIGYVSGTVGELLNVKPIITLNEEGKYVTHAKVRGRDQSLRRLMDALTEQVRDTLSDIAIVHGAAEQESADFMRKARQLPNVREVFFSQVSPALGVHTGPGLVGFIVSPISAQP